MFANADRKPPRFLHQIRQIRPTFAHAGNKPTLLSIVAERALKRLPASGSGSGLRSITPNGQETGEKSRFDVILHEGMSSLVGALNAFADHRVSIFPSRP
jgi:hypothetical protein